MSEGRRSARGGRDRSGWAWCLPVALVAAILALGWAATPDARRPSLRGIGRTPEVPAVEAWVDPAQLSFDGIEALDPRWIEELSFVAAELPPFRVEDTAALASLSDTLAAVSFVRSVPRLEATAEQGIELELELRRPVACIPAGARFLTVDDEGVLLSGTWPAPLRVDGIALPVLGPMSDADGLFALAQAGDWLAETTHLDALDVAVSLAREVSPEARRTLGRVLIDATRAREASVEEPGVRLLLEERRLVLFGRRPSADEPGELEVTRKWSSVERALEALHDPLLPLDWSVVDVRWDYPEVALREPLLAVRSPEPAAGRRPERARSREKVVPEIRPEIPRGRVR